MSTPHIKGGVDIGLIYSLKQFLQNTRECVQFSFNHRIPGAKLLHLPQKFSGDRA
jgi:hypothetical protein